jgi:hypothetical protein
MATFNEVHSRAMNSADHRLRPGERWRVALREPFTLACLPQENIPETIQIVTFIMTKSGRLDFASPADRRVVADWNERHRNTPPSYFGLPEWLDR